MALPATQIYIPLDKQYDPALDKSPVYAYNPQKAAALVKASGYQGQPMTLHYATNFTWEASMAPGLQQDLRQIVGYIRLDKPEAALRFGRKLIKKAESLSTFPERGRVIGRLVLDFEAVAA